MQLLHNAAILGLCAILCMTTAVAQATVVIDNGHPGTVSSGTWSKSGGADPYGADSVWSRNGATYTWRFTPVVAGEYDIAMWWTSWPSRAAAVPIDITYTGGTKHFTIDQTKGAGQWNSLGSYVFEPNVSYQVKITAPPGPASTCADAVRIQPVAPPDAVPAARIGGISPNPAPPGDLVYFVGSGSDSDGVIVGYRWESDIDGPLSEDASFSTGALTAGTHRVTFRVLDDAGHWSQFAERTLVISAPATMLIIDNDDPTTVSTGKWLKSGADEPHGRDSLWSRNGASYAWRFTPQVSGQYDIAMWWTGWASRSAAVPVEIVYAGGIDRLTIDQRRGAGQWNSLGTYPFQAHTTYQVKITAAQGPASTNADAVRVGLVPEHNTAPTAIIDAIVPNPGLEGEEIRFLGHGDDPDGSIVRYQWRSSIDGFLGDTEGFHTTALSAGSHVIYFSVADNAGALSREVAQSFDVYPKGGPTTEQLFVCLLNFSSTDVGYLRSLLTSLGATQEDSDVWEYHNLIMDKTYRIRIVQDIDGMREALYTPGAHVIVKGHGNYGLGAVFTPDYAREHEVLDDIRFVDDDLIFNYSSRWIAVRIYRMARVGKWSNWWPEFSDGTSAIMPYDFGDPRGDPPYNYYITYRVPGDPTHYKIETVRNSAVERFPDSGVPAWYSPTGSGPDPGKPDDQKYFIRNPTMDFDWPVTCAGQECPQPHYLGKTILFRKELELDPARFAYSRLLYDACNVGSYYFDTFQKGITFFSADDSWTSGTYVYLKAYIEGKSDHEIWALMQKHQPVYDYYDFNKRPSEQ